MTYAALETSRSSGQPVERRFNALGPNECRVEGDVAYLALPSGHEAILDAADLPLVRGYRWFAVINRLGSVRGVRTNLVLTPGRKGKKTTLLIHRLILAAPAHLDVDHVNRKPLDNRRLNLRPCTPSQNNCNRPAVKASGYKGVHGTHYGKWNALIRYGGRNHYIGTFDSAEEAARAYDQAACSYHGEFAYLNLPCNEVAA